MSLLKLPNELLLEIVKEFEEPIHLYSLLIINRRVASLLADLLFDFAVRGDLFDKHATRVLYGLAVNDLDDRIALLFEKRGSTRLGHKVLVIAAHENDQTVVRAMLRNGVDINARFCISSLKTTVPPRFKYEPIAPPNSQEEMVRRFFGEHWGNSGQTVFGCTALWCAATYGYQNIVGALLEHGAGIFSEGNYERTPIHQAVIGRWPAILRLLLDYAAATAAGAVDLKEYLGRTPLHFAAKFGHCLMIKALLERGADPNSEDEIGRTPRMMANLRKDKELHDLINGVKIALPQGPSDTSPIIQLPG